MLIAGCDQNRLKATTLDDPDFLTSRAKEEYRADNASLPSEVMQSEIEQLEPINH